MIGSKQILFTLLVAIVMVCYETRYLLVSIKTENGGGSNEIMNNLKARRGNIGLKLFHKH